MIPPQAASSCEELMVTASPANEGENSTWMTASTSEVPVSTSGFGSIWTVMAGEEPEPVAVPEPDPAPLLQEWVLWQPLVARLLAPATGASPSRGRAATRARATRRNDRLRLMGGIVYRHSMRAHPHS